MKVRLKTLDPKRTLVLATRNEHKVVELRAILGTLIDECDLTVVSSSQFQHAPSVTETEVTFAGNAAKKAAVLAKATGMPSIADDSGLTVSVFGGAPGVFSARWSGSLGGGPETTRTARDAANVRLLLDQLADVPDEHRQAAFVCAAVLVMPDGRVESSFGEITGTLTREPIGDRGFGYDPIFRPDGATRTLAQYSDEEKNAVSHRGRAFRAMIPILAELFAP